MSSSDMEYARALDLPPFMPIEENYLPPNTFINFHFAPHGIPEHLEGVETMFPEADIFVAELVNWGNEHVKAYRAITKGDQKTLGRAARSVRGNLMEEYIKARFRMLFRSWKPLLFIDQSESDKQQRIPDFLDDSLRDFRADTLEEALELCADIEAEVARKSSIRNRIMVRNLGEKATELVKQHPKLKDKPHVEVLVPLGLMHEPIYDYLREQPAVSDRITASCWSGAHGLPPEEEVRLAYIESRAPSREQLLTTLGVHMIGSTIGSLMRAHDSIYNPYMAPRGVHNTEYEVVLRCVQLITECDTGIQLMLDVLNGDRSEKNKQQLLDCIKVANQQILEETGHGIDMETNVPL